jgi:uncharacterized protein (DUF362 family)
MKTDTAMVWIDRVEDIFSYQEIYSVTSNILHNFKPHLALNPGSSVMIKLNLCLLKGPETGATVNPYVAKALVEWLLENYDLKMIFLAEADATHLSADMAFKILGWYDFFKDSPKVKLFNLSTDKTIPINTHYSQQLKMSKQMLDVDCLISFAKLKTHTQQKITGIMKNQFGAIPFKYKIVYHPKLSETIYDATAARIPDLNIIDGLISMEGNGPTNGVPRWTKLILASNDPLSMDHFCARLMGFNPLSIPHLKLAIENSLGTTDYHVHGNPPVPLNLKFQFLPKWKEVIKKSIGLLQKETINEEA